MMKSRKREKLLKKQFDIFILPSVCIMSAIDRITNKNNERSGGKHTWLALEHNVPSSASYTEPSGCTRHFWTVAQSVGAARTEEDWPRLSNWKVTEGQGFLVPFLARPSQMWGESPETGDFELCRFFHLPSCGLMLLPKPAFCNEYDSANEEAGSTSVWVMDCVLRRGHPKCHFLQSEWKSHIIILFQLEWLTELAFCILGILSL